MRRTIAKLCGAALETGDFSVDVGATLKVANDRHLLQTPRQDKSSDLL